LTNISGRDYSAGLVDGIVKPRLKFHSFAFGSAPVGEEKQRQTDGTKACALTISGIFWQEYQSRRPRQRERGARERAERREEERQEEKTQGGKERRKSERKKAAWTLRLRETTA